MTNHKMKKVDQMLLEHEFNGVVLIAYQSKIMWSKGYGYADFEHDVPNTAETKFRIGSITKTITAVAIMQLLEKKLIKLDDTLNHFIADYPHGEQITVKHLLTHTSGISNFELDADFYDVIHSPSFSEKLIDLFKYQPLQFIPGEEYSYSVSGYFLLGYIIEKVTGLRYEDYLKEYIFEPLGMKNTGFDHYKPIIKGRAKGYEMDGFEIQNTDFVDMRIAGAGGGLYSTVGDLYLLQVGLFNQKILNKESFDMMNTNQVRINDQTHYGYGLFLQEDEIFGKKQHKNYHTGGGPGVRSILAYYVEEQLLCVMISNVNNRKIFNDSHALMEEILFKDND